MIATALATGWQFQQAGRYADAARCYHELLTQEPDHADALHLFGVLHHQSGHHERAVELIGRAAALRPDCASYHANLAEAHRALKEPERAADCCRTALRLKPEYPEAANNLGLALHDLGRHAEAVEQYEAALAMQPDFAQAQNNRGTSLRALGKAAEAIEAYRAALQFDPAFALAHANLGQLLADQGQPVEGLSHCEEAVRLQPDLPAAHNNLGNVLRALERWAKARAAYAEAIRLEPDLVVAHANLGQTLLREGRIRAAVPHFRRAAELAPQHATAWQKLAHVLGLSDDWPAAIPCCERRVQLTPEDADAHNDLGWANQSDGRHVAAEASYRRALELCPDHLDAWLNLGALHEELGAMAEAEACYRQAETRRPRSPLPLARRAVLARARLPDADRDELRFHLYRQGSPFLRMNLLFALAQVADACGDHAEAAACLEPANALAREMFRGRGQTYDADEHTRNVDRLIDAFAPDLFRRLDGAGVDDARLVFVFGLPRSGTTLVEQVLASHSRVFGAGELPLAHRAMDALLTAADWPEDLAACLGAVDGARLRQLADGYLEGLQARLALQAPAATPARIVDKMPGNFLYLGLIALMFPRATLIHVRRDVRDVAVSCWMTQFGNIRWAHDQEDLARHIRDYRRVMAHWHTVLSRTVHEVCYERLVEDFEPEARRLVAACGLDWEPTCLDFHKTSRPIRTASVTQVREPLYRRALGRWKAYEPYLKSLFDRIQVTTDF
jgi:tetratricopeptide (TPR) repeat protein